MRTSEVYGYGMIRPAASVSSIKPSPARYLGNFDRYKAGIEPNRLWFDEKLFPTDIFPNIDLEIDEDLKEYRVIMIVRDGGGSIKYHKATGHARIVSSMHVGRTLTWRLPITRGKSIVSVRGGISSLTKITGFLRDLGMAEYEHSDSWPWHLSCRDRKPFPGSDCAFQSIARWRQWADIAGRIGTRRKIAKVEIEH